MWDESMWDESVYDDHLFRFRMPAAASVTSRRDVAVAPM